VGNVEMVAQIVRDDVMVVSAAWNRHWRMASYRSISGPIRADHGGRMDRSTAISGTGRQRLGTYQWQFSGQVDGNPQVPCGHTTLICKSAPGSG